MAAAQGLAIAPPTKPRCADRIPFVERVARGQGLRPDSTDDVVQVTLLTVHRARQTSIRTARLQLGLEPLRSGVRSTDCGALAGCDPTEIHAPFAPPKPFGSEAAGSEETTFDIDQTEESSIRPWGKLSGRQR